jgi:hypothetical protein
MKRVPLSLLSLVLAAVAAGTPAQESAPLVRKPKAVIVRKPKAEKPTPTPEAAGEAKPAPEVADPRLVIVALVNGHRLTKAELNFLVDRRIGILGHKMTTADDEVTMMVLDRKMRPDTALSADPELAEDIRRDREASRRRLEGEVTQEWVEQRILADEARRQGIILDPRELEERRKSARAATGLDAKALTEFLNRFGMTDADLDREVAETVMVEKLLQKYVAVNYTDAMLREIFDRAPHEFTAPLRVRIAHYVLALTGDESPAEMEMHRERANAVRRKLARESDPAKALSGENNLDKGYFAVADAGWFRLDGEGLAPAVLAAAAKLKAGETSGVIEDTEATQDGRRRLRSLQVIKVLDRLEAGTPDFATAKPVIAARVAEECRSELLDRLRSAKTHRVVINLGGIPASKLPGADDVIRMQASGKALDLRRPG